MVNKDRVLCCQIAFTYVGSIVGAGFASGQEILKFFGGYGQKGIWGALAAGLLFAILGSLVVSTTAAQKIKNYAQYIEYLFGGRMSRVFDLVIMVFLYCGLSVMLVAGGSLFYQVLGCPPWLGFLFTLLISYTVLLTGTDGLLWLNTLLIPGLLAICAGTAVWGIVTADTAVWANGHGISLPGCWVFASLLYVAYNFVLGTVILSSLDNRPTYACVKGAVTGGLILGALAALTCQALLLQGKKVVFHDIPMLALAGQIHPWVGLIYSLAMWAAILTTALGNGFGLLKRLENCCAWPRPLLSMAVFLPTLPFVGWPLARAVGTVYPLLGYVGILFIVAIIMKIRLPSGRT